MISRVPLDWWIKVGIILLASMMMMITGWMSYVAAIMLELLVLIDFMYDADKRSWRSPFYRDCYRCHDGQIARLDTSAHLIVGVPCPDCNGTRRVLHPVWRRLQWRVRRARDGLRAVRGGRREGQGGVTPRRQGG